MKHTMTYVRVGSVIVLGIMLLTGSALAVTIQGTGGTTQPYGYYNPYDSMYGNTGSCGAPSPYGITPYPYPQPQPQPQPQMPNQYCMQPQRQMQWRPPQWVPVQVMVPGRWETRPVWIPGQEVTLYRPIPGYWQRTNMDGTPDVSVYRTSTGWQVAPQTTNGYFDSQGVWHEAEKK